MRMRGGSVDRPLRDLLRGVQRLAIQGADEGSEITMPAQARPRFLDRSTLTLLLGNIPRPMVKQKPPMKMDPGSLEAITARLAQRGSRGAEANVQADVRQLLLAAPLSPEPGDLVEMETKVGEGQRIDVEVGATVIEVKREGTVGSYLPVVDTTR
jgi:hypothetical protein